jgi:hypothetical protein
MTERPKRPSSFRIEAADLDMPESVKCPFCGGLETELHSPFGPQLSVATYWCRPCGSPVEWLKWQSAESRAAAAATRSSPEDPR